MANDEKESAGVPQASQRGLAGPLSEEGKQVRDAVRKGEIPDEDALKKAHAESGYRYPDSFYRLDPDLEAQKVPGDNERGQQRDAPDASDPATARAQAAAKEGLRRSTELQEQRDGIREAASVPAGVQTKAASGPTTNKSGSGPRENKAGEGAAASVDFASSAASDAAREAGLTDADFKGLRPSGERGFTKGDVDDAIARKDG